MGFLKKAVLVVTYIFILLNAAVWAAGLALYSEDVHLEYCDEMYILPGCSGGKFYKELDSNVYQCDLASFSDVVYKMLDDGYKLYKYDVSGSGIDIILCQKDDFYRLYYKRDRVLTVISNHYEKSYVPFTYITEGSKQE